MRSASAKTFWLLGAVLAVLTLQSIPQAQAGSPPERCETARFQFNQFGKFVALVWQRAAAFPQPSKTEVEFTFSLGCHDFSARVADGIFRISGTNTLEAAYGRLTELNLVELSGYKYPNIQVDPYFHYLKVVFTTSSVTVAPDASPSVFLADTVVGAKVNGGDLIPLYFEGKATVLSLRQTDTIDIYTKARSLHVRIPRLTIDAPNREIAVYAFATFPEK